MKKLQILKKDFKLAFFSNTVFFICLQRRRHSCSGRFKFKLGRKLAKSEALTIATKFNEPPLIINILYKIIGFSFSNNSEVSQIQSEEKKLSNY